MAREQKVEAKYMAVDEHEVLYRPSKVVDSIYNNRGQSLEEVTQASVDDLEEQRYPGVQYIVQIIKKVSSLDNNKRPVTVEDIA